MYILIIKQNSILMESEIHHSDEILNIMYAIMVLKDSDWGQITSHIQTFPVQILAIMNKNLICWYLMYQICFTVSLES